MKLHRHKTSWFTFAIVLLYSMNSYAQHFNKFWDTRLGGLKDELAMAFIQTKDSGFVIAGTSISNAGGDKSQPNWDTTQMSTDIWVVKLDATGQKVWDKRFGGTSTEGSISLIEADEGFLICSTTSSDKNGDVGYPLQDTSLSRGDLWLLYINKNGTKIWDKRYGGLRMETAHGVAISADKSILLGSYSNSPASGSKSENNRGDYTDIDYWVVKLDQAGNKQWDKRYGGTKDDILYAVLPTTNEGWLLAGLSYSDASGDKTENNRWIGLPNQKTDYWVVRIDSIGQKLWDKTYGSTDNDNLRDAIATDDGGFLLVGESSSTAGFDKSQSNHGNGYNDIWVVKIDSAGTRQWDKVYGGTKGESVKKVSPSQRGGYLLSSITSSPLSGDKTEENLGTNQCWVVEIDSVGTLLWDKTIFVPGSTINGYALQTIDGCYAVAVSTAEGSGGYCSHTYYGSQPNYDYWALKFCMESFNSIEQRAGNQDTRQIQAWPNPFATDVSIALTGQPVTTAKYTITNNAGQIVYQQQETNLAAGYTKMLDLSYLPNGVYFIEVSTPEGKVMQRVVKQ